MVVPEGLFPEKMGYRYGQSSKASKFAISRPLIGTKIQFTRLHFVIYFTKVSNLAVVCSQPTLYQNES